MIQAKHAMLFLVLLLIATLSTGYTLYNRYLSRVDNVMDHDGKSLSRYSVEIEVSGTKGSYVADLGILHIPADGHIRVEPTLAWASRDLSIAISGRLVLSGPEYYEVEMPCMVSQNMPCIRIEVVIPGYDEPMAIKGGDYSARVELWWRAEGAGKASIELIILYYRG